MSHGRPCQTSRFGFCGERSGFVTRPSNHTTSAAKSGSMTSAAVDAAGLKVSAPGRKSIPRLSAGARPDEVVDLLVGLGVAERRVHLDRDEVRDGQPDRPSELARQPLGDERAGSLAGAPELHHVQAVVVRLDEPGQRATLAQGRDVAGRDDGPDHARRA